MKLDSRIIDGKKPLTCFDSDEAKQFIGKKGFFTDELNQFRDLNNVQETILKNVWPNESYCFIASVTGHKYFLPSEWVDIGEPEKKWRPYTLDDFVKRFDSEVGTRVFLMRSKTTPENQRRLLLTGILQDENLGGCGVCLGGFYFTFSNLFDMFDVRFGKEDWQPFGVEDVSE